jgi:hypothetical protein
MLGGSGSGLFFLHKKWQQTYVENFFSSENKHFGSQIPLGDGGRSSSNKQLFYFFIFVKLSLDNAITVEDPGRKLI